MSISDVQIFCNAYGFTDEYNHKLLVDNKLGDLTISAVKKFQIEATHEGLYNRAIDGQPGPYTQIAIAQYETNHSNWFVGIPSIYHHQETSYTCGPASSMMALSKLGVTGENESEMATLEKTTANGTSHGPLMSGIVAEAEKHNVKLTCKEATFILTSWGGLKDIIMNNKQSVIAHGECAGWPSQYKVYKGGHYVEPVAINLVDNLIRINDPDRGTIQYTLKEFKAGLDLNPQPCFIVLSQS
jgi:hypothetical protein